MKNKIIAGIVFILFSTLLYAQNKANCNACVFLDPSFKGAKALYDKPNGKIIKYLKHNLKEEFYINLDILDRIDSMFYVRAYCDFDGTTLKGWIIKDSLIGIYSRGYKGNPLILYYQPNLASKKICSLNANIFAMYIVLDCIGKWLKVKATYKGKFYIGWMSSDMQCCNVYSTCS